MRAEQACTCDRGDCSCWYCGHCDAYYTPIDYGQTFRCCPACWLERVLPCVSEVDDAQPVYCGEPATLFLVDGRDVVMVCGVATIGDRIVFEWRKA